MDKKQFKGKHIFRLKQGENMCGEKTLWIDLYGSSYSPAATNAKTAKEFAKILRDAAEWIENKPASFWRKSA